MGVPTKCSRPSHVDSRCLSDLITAFQNEQVHRLKTKKENLKPHNLFVFPVPLIFKTFTSNAQYLLEVKIISKGKNTPTEKPFCREVQTIIPPCNFDILTYFVQHKRWIFWPKYFFLPTAKHSCDAYYSEWPNKSPLTCV